MKRKMYTIAKKTVHRVPSQLSRNGRVIFIIIDILRGLILSMTARHTRELIKKSRDRRGVIYNIFKTRSSVRPLQLDAKHNSHRYRYILYIIP